MKKLTQMITAVGVLGLVLSGCGEKEHPEIEITIKDYGKSLRNRLERPFHGHRGGSRGRIYYRFTTFEERALIC